MKVSQAIFRLCANWLRTKGYTPYTCTTVPDISGNVPQEEPDLIALHPTNRPLRIYLQRNYGSRITPETEGTGERVVYATGFEDLRELLNTGRPHVSPTTASFF